MRLCIQHGKQVGHTQRKTWGANTGGGENDRAKWFGNLKRQTEKYVKHIAGEFFSLVRGAPAHGAGVLPEGVPVRRHQVEGGLLQHHPGRAAHRSEHQDQADTDEPQ